MTIYKYESKCRECANWMPEWQGRPSLVGVCTVDVPFLSFVAGRGWGCAPSWEGARLCRGFVVSVGAQAMAQLESICRWLMALPLDDRRLELSRMEREDEAAVETIKGRLLAMAIERKAAKAVMA